MPAGKAGKQYFVPLGKTGKSENCASQGIWVQDQVVWCCHQSIVDFFCKRQYKCPGHVKLLSKYLNADSWATHCSRVYVRVGRLLRARGQSGQVQFLECH